MTAPETPRSRPTAVTHEVTNQPPPLTGHDVADDAVLLEGVRREGAGWHVDELHRFGRYAGGEEAQRWADQANRHEPELRTHDRFGHRVDEVEFHPAYHALMDASVGAGSRARPGPTGVRAPMSPGPAASCWPRPWNRGTCARSP